MARNDTLLIDGILDDRVAMRLPSDRRDEAFEFFAFEQTLRDADLSRDELKGGCIDGRDDGGIDGFFILVNGHPLIEADSFLWPRSGCELDVWIITCKHHDTFRQAPVDNLVASLTELFDLGISNDQLKGPYSESLLKARTLLSVAYRKLSPRMNRFGIHFAYASRGDADQVGESIKSRSLQAVDIAQNLFGNCHVTFSFLGAAELISIHRKVRTFSLELPFLEALTRGERYILLCRLSAFNDFVVDENGKLRRYLFDSNVRAFMGLNRVNEDIRETLNTPDSPDFWWLNNGITILANTATVTGKSIQLEGVQIVNGLQTTESIARYFADGNHDPKERAVLIKIIVSTDPSIRDEIIRATNNQTTVELASLHATDKIQRDIEEILVRDGLYYERRTNFYVSQGQPASHIITPLYLAAGYVNLILKSPASASVLRARFMRTGTSYGRVFSQNAPLRVWPNIARILKRTDSVLERLRPTGTMANERFLKSWRQILAFLAIGRCLGSFAYSASELASFQTSLLTDELLTACWGSLGLQIPTGTRIRRGIGREAVMSVCEYAAKEFSITGVACVERSFLPRIGSGEELSPEFIEQVNKALPKQPWKPGVHRAVANKLGCRSEKVSEAIEQLIATGARNFQKDGVVYGSDGTILEIDEERLASDAAEKTNQVIGGWS